MNAHPHSVLISWLCEGEVRDSLEWYQRIILKIKCARSVSEICTFLVGISAQENNVYKHCASFKHVLHSC